MPAWDRRYNISGQVLVGNQLDRWCQLLDKVLNTTVPAGAISHMTGATSVSAGSSIGFLASTGIDDHEFWAFICGEQEQWRQFADTLKHELDSVGFESQIVVHQSIMVLL